MRFRALYADAYRDVLRFAQRRVDPSRAEDVTADAFLVVRVAEAAPFAGLSDGLDADLLAQRLDLAAAWRRLSETDQETLSLTVFEDLTSPQAASVLGITAASYRLRLLRARRALRRQLELADSPSDVEMESLP
jgi:RNA polymerase sigma-70 factor (ECF subfamily)